MASVIWLLVESSGFFFLVIIWVQARKGGNCCPTESSSVTQEGLILHLFESFETDLASLIWVVVARSGF